jgi:eukaryotic-like serine/threonine-protein kinase
MAPADEKLFEPVAPDRASAVHPTAPVEPGGMVADKYRIERTIGFGGMGVICEATHLELGTKVAVKFVRFERASDDRTVARFLTEARSAAQLRSQHTCRVVDCGRLESGGPYMVMEYLEGADLRSIISAQAPLPVEDSVCFVSQGLEALAEAHARGIVHRDIKPENLFLTQGPDGGAMIKVLDFGISKQLGRAQNNSRSLTEPTESIGSPYHMSPEQMIDPTAVDARTDIWAMGVVLYELLTGRLPFEGETTPQICANVMTAQPKSPLEIRPDLPEALVHVVMSCMEKDREKRVPDVGALSRALENFGGARSGLSAARVEGILSRAKDVKSTRQVSSETSRARDDDDEGGEVRPNDIPGLSRAGKGRVWVALGVVLAGGIAYYAVEKLRSSGAETIASPAESASAIAAPSAESSSQAAPAPSSSRPSEQNRPIQKAARKAKPVGSNFSSGEAPVGSPKSNEKDFPASDKPGLYPELKPVPDLPSGE